MRICEERLCTGCSLCASVCPQGAVSMESDSEGFLRPVVNCQICTQCGACQKRCPVNGGQPNPPIRALAAYSKDKDIRKRSSSGGIFYSLAMSVIEGGGVVFGAGYTDGLRVVHKACEDRDGLFELMGSKYVQSDISGVYEKIGESLMSGKRVLFSGTPCQCAAVKNRFLVSEGLLLVDFICHGVPTPALWEKYVKEEFPEAKSAFFRDKSRGWEEFSMRMVCEKGSYSASLYKDPYLRMFLRNYALRPSCYECLRKNESYFSDITLADFWGISKVFPEMNDDKGTSAVIIRSEKGKELFEKVKSGIAYKYTDVKTVRTVNTAYAESVKLPSEREDFFKDMREGVRFDALAGKYLKPVPTSEIVKIRIKKSVKKLIGKLYKLKK